MGGRSLLLVSLCYLCVAKTAAEIDMDYYLGSLRSSCLGRKGENICQIDCQGASSFCFQGQCVCETKTATPIVQAALVWNMLPLSIQQALDKLLKKHFRILLIDGIKEIEVMAADDYVEKSSKSPSLRHHIAHFCPNLGDARRCIRKCMETGTPAFCGKDHVCYCGHRYSAHDSNPEIDPDAVMNRFRDLYEKYFGRNPNEPGKTIIEEVHYKKDKVERKKNKEAGRKRSNAKNKVGRKKSKAT